MSVREKREEEEKVRFPYLARAGMQWGGLATVTDGGGGGACEAAALGAREEAVRRWRQLWSSKAGREAYLWAW